MGVEYIVDQTGTMTAKGSEASSKPPPFGSPYCVEGTAQGLVPPAARGEPKGGGNGQFIIQTPLRRGGWGVR